MEETITYVLLAVSAILNVYFYLKTKELALKSSIESEKIKALEASLKVAKSKPTAEADFFLREILNSGATVNIEVLDKAHLMLISPKGMQ